MKKNIFFMNKWILGLLLIFSSLLQAQEGTKQVSPQANRLSGLYYNPSSNYGSYFNAPDDNNINFVISNFNTERFYFGFSWTNYGNASAADQVLNYSTQSEYMYYRILDSDGVVVAGPTLLPRAAGSAGQITTYDQAVAGPNISGTNPAGYSPLQFTPTKNDTFVIQ